MRAFASVCADSARMQASASLQGSAGTNNSPADQTPKGPAGVDCDPRLPNRSALPFPNRHHRARSMSTRLVLEGQFGCLNRSIPRRGQRLVERCDLAEAW